MQSKSKSQSNKHLAEEKTKESDRRKGKKGKKRERGRERKKLQTLDNEVGMTVCVVVEIPLLALACPQERRRQN